MTRAFRRLLVCTAAVYLLGFAAEPISTIDDQVMLTGAMNLIKTGKLVLPGRFAQSAGGGPSFGRTAPGGDVYIKYPPGYPLVLAVFLFPAKAAGLWLGGVAADVVLCLPSILILLATATLLWRTCLRLGLSSTAGQIAAAGFALGSFAWPYAGINFSEPLQMLCVMAGFYGLLAAFQDESRWKFHLLTGGVALGYGVLTKSSLGLLMPVMAAGGLWAWTARDSLKTGLVRSVLFGLPSAAAGVYLLALNALVFGNASDFGYQGESFTGSLLQGVRNLTIGWDKGLIWFAPLAILLPVGVWKLRASSWTGLTLLGCCAAYLLLIAQWYGYRGGNCWGPRLLMPVLPLLLLLAAAALDGRFWRGAGILLVALGLAVNVLGVLINYQSFYSAVASSPGKPDWQDPVYSQIRGHIWLLRVQLAKKSLSDPEESVALWGSPPWIVRNAAAKPAPYLEYNKPVLAPWPLRIALRNPWSRRADLWYLRALMEVAIMRYEAADLAGATALLQEGLRIEPTYTPMVAAQGMIYFSARDLPRALTHFDRAVALDPTYELAWYGRAVTLEALGNRGEAMLSYKRLLQLPGRKVNRKEIEQSLSRLSR